jgi:hypothetical protein
MIAFNYFIRSVAKMTIKRHFSEHPEKFIKKISGKPEM